MALEGLYLMRVLPPRTYTVNARAEAKVLPFGIQHPAKMHPALCRDLFLRYTQPGQTVFDPFGGRGTSLIGVTLGRDVILNELEPPFVEHIRANYAHLKAHTLPGMTLGEATILQGDSRSLPLPSADHAGVVHACVSSPPYEGVCSDWNLTSKKLQGESVAYADERHQPRRNIGNLRHDSDAVDAAVTSPPFGEMNSTTAGGNVGKMRPAKGGIGYDGEDRHNWVYSETTPGQIGNLPHAAITSPPFVNCRQAMGTTQSAGSGIVSDQAIGASQAGLIGNDGYGDSPGQIYAMPAGEVAAAISSPPYGDVASRDRSQEPYCLALDPKLKAEYGAGDTNRHIDGYGHSAGQIGDLKHVDAAVSSPPYGTTHLESALDVRSGEPFRPWSERKKDQGYAGEDARDIGMETYATACLAVYRECFRVVRPGGVLVLVTGNYVRDGKVIDLAEDTIKLAVAAGWTPVERWRHEKSTVSFWRRLHHKQGRPVVTHEDVLVFAKGAPAWEFAELPPTVKAPADLSEARALVGLGEVGMLPLPLGEDVA